MKRVTKLRMPKGPFDLIGYRPSTRRKKYFEALCKKEDGWRPQQLLDVSLDFLMMRSEKEIKDIFYGVMTGQWDRESFEAPTGEKSSEAPAHRKTAG